VVQVAEAAVGARQRGADPIAWLCDRAGSLFDPELVEQFSGQADSLLATLQTPSRWQAVVALEPTPRKAFSGGTLDAALRAIGEFADLKSPYLVGHSEHVASLACDAAALIGLPADEVTDIRQAGSIHDLGRVAVSAGTWGRLGPLSRDEWERVRLHPYHTARILDGARSLASIGSIASLHHERLDGSGYTRAVPAGLIPVGARLLAAADVYAAMTEPRPHRVAFAPDVAATEMHSEARASRLEGNAVGAVLAAAGHRPRRRSEAIAGLTTREIEVLALVARGRTNREIAEELVVSLKTVDAHIQHIYAKAQVRTRAGATLFAMQHGMMASR
jgi:DNA-binding CsgD family transcriptional regulator